MTQGGTLARHSEDTKIASSRITIETEIHLPELIQRAVKWVFDHANWKDGVVASGKNEGVTASGHSGAATASGHLGKAKATAGSALFLLRREHNTWKITHVWAGIAGADGIKPDTFYGDYRVDKPTYKH